MMCYLLCCFVIGILDLEGLATTNDRKIILGTDPKCGRSSLRSASKILA